METIYARNVNDALSKGLWLLQSSCLPETSRNGPVLVARGPVMTEYSRPLERVLFSGQRDANPYFHLMESLWMLAGRKDAEWPVYFNSKFQNFAEPDGTLHGAYGYRWRKHFFKDQIKETVKLLTESPDTRRAVIAMWDPLSDCSPQTNPKDIPCNTTIYLDLRGGALNFTSLCRSNDIVWGAYGANAVHMSVLQEYLAAYGGWSVGVYRQYSHNFHAYTAMEGYPTINPVAIGCRDLYTTFEVKPYPLVQGSGIEAINEFDDDLELFLRDPKTLQHYDQPFFNDVAKPMFLSWYERKNKISDGLDWAGKIKASDWRMACIEWIKRRIK